MQYYSSLLDIVKERDTVLSEDCRRLSLDVKDKWELTGQRGMEKIFQAPSKACAKDGWHDCMRLGGRQHTHTHTDTE